MGACTSCDFPLFVWLLFCMTKATSVSCAFTILVYMKVFPQNSVILQMCFDAVRTWKICVLPHSHEMHFGKLMHSVHAHPLGMVGGPEVSRWKVSPKSVEVRSGGQHIQSLSRICVSSIMSTITWSCGLTCPRVTIPHPDPDLLLVLLKGMGTGSCFDSIYVCTGMLLKAKTDVPCEIHDQISWLFPLALKPLWISWTGEVVGFLKNKQTKNKKQNKKTS